MARYNRYSVVLFSNQHSVTSTVSTICGTLSVIICYAMIHEMLICHASTIAMLVSKGFLGSNARPFIVSCNEMLMQDAVYKTKSLLS